MNIIAIFSSNKITNGASKRYIELLRQLSDKGHQITFIAESDMGLKNIDHIKIRTPKGILPKRFELIKQVLFNIKRIKTDTKNSDFIMVFGETNILASIILKKLLKIPLYIGIRSNIYISKKIKVYKSGLGIGKIKSKNSFLLKVYMSLVLKYERFLYNRANGIIVQNMDDYNHIYDLVKHDNINIIPNNLNVSWIDNSYANSNDSTELKKIIFVGSLNERKGILFLVEAINKLIMEGKKLELIVLGDGPQQKEIETYIEKHKLKSFVKMYGHVNDPAFYIRNSDLLVVPSIFDSFPNVILESLNIGTPVIGSDIGGIKVQLEYKELLFRPASEESIYNKLKWLLDKENYIICKGLCEERKEMFVFDWAQEFEKVFDL
ncbi:Glycosyltransferase involved in cell wall bisynthesis [Lentibacillus halodurans]|uniref:Glycosyltransferase involved in cell wall bisynthesis n=1 Tax=Lentibacillus halodurans TaxID=237679 RepID=A0A1I0XL45_9BACI|nr:glycosyltransferase family 4 protein [Lentibacillus halodurans]SFB01040.1 Glycosyltransferase involved in cell wall bisynthesis [Lentibacillus halodurans]